MFWFNVFNISGHSSSKVLFPSLLKGKNIFLSFFFFALFDKCQMWITYIHFIAYVHLLKKGRRLEVTMLLVCVCPLFWLMSQLWVFTEFVVDVMPLMAFPTAPPPPNSVIWLFWLIALFEFVLGMSLSLCVWHWLYMGKLSFLLDVHEILMLFIRMLMCLESRLSSSFRCNIDWCNFAYWNNDRVLLVVTVIASINIMWIVLYRFIVFCVFWRALILFLCCFVYLWWLCVGHRLLS